MKKCYIAGKIGNLPEAEYKAKFEQAEQSLIFLGYQPVNPVKIHDNCTHIKTWQEYMKCDIVALIECDALYALNNWRDSPGATVEVNLAIGLKLHIIYQPTPGQQFSE